VLTLESPPFQSTQPKTEPKPLKPERRLESGRASEDEIQQLAYKKWQQAGCPVSDGIEFWLSAETEILRGNCC
jgi:hypothetical protein